MHKIKLKFISLFLRLRRFFVVFGLVFCFAVLFFGQSVSAYTLDPLSEWEVDYAALTFWNDVNTPLGNSSISLHQNTASGDWQYRVSVSPYTGGYFPAGTYNWNFRVSVPVGMNNIFNIKINLFQGSYSGYGEVWATNNPSVSWSPCDYAFSPGGSSGSDYQFVEVAARTPKNENVSYLMYRVQFTLPYNVYTDISYVFDLDRTPYTPGSVSDDPIYARPSDPDAVTGSLQKEQELFDSMEEKQNDSVSWISQFAYILDTSWLTDGVRGISGYLNYLTGMGSLNGKLFSNSFYFMRYVYFSLALAVIPLVIGSSIRALGNSSRKK